MSHVIPVGSATTNAGAYSANRAVNVVMPASVGGTAKSSRALPRTPHPMVGHDRGVDPDRGLGNLGLHRGLLS
jgi:hypothetical protein